MEARSRGALDRNPGRERLDRTVIVFGYGNPGRQDDGLGPAAAEAIAQQKWPGVTVQTNYQLNIEDADEAAAHDWVVFVDAATSGPEPFTVRQTAPAAETAFSSHVMSPETVLAICRDYYGKVPHAVVIAIRGYEFEFSESLSAPASENLAHALPWITRHISACLDMPDDLDADADGRDAVTTPGQRHARG